MKTKLTLLLIFLSAYSFAQLRPYTPYQGKGYVLQVDNYWINKFLKIPATEGTAPTLAGVIDSAGAGFQLLKGNNRFANSKGLGLGWNYYPELAEVNSIAAAAVSAAPVPTLQHVTTSGNSTSLGAIFGGNITIGTGASTQRNLYINRGLSGSTTSYGIYQDGVIASTVTTNAIYNAAAVNTAAASFTVANVMLFRANQGTVGAGSTINNQYGFYVENLSGATTNYGYYSGLLSGAGKYNLFISGTAINYINGSLMVGSSTDNGQKLQVTGKIRVSQGLSGTAGTDSLVVHDNTSKEIKFIAPGYYGTAASVALKADINNSILTGITNAAQYKLSALNTAPASATATGTLGEIRITSGFIFVCIATNTWVRAALATF